MVVNENEAKLNGFSATFRRDRDTATDMLRRPTPCALLLARRLCASGAEIVTPAGATTAIPRLGSSDAFVKLDVGGKVFATLRSTASISPVLRNAMAAADANPALLTAEGAVFVDRRPDAFPQVLEHLRNKADAVERPGRLLRLRLAKTITVEMEPLSWLQLRELHVEAGYYKLMELQKEAANHQLKSGSFSRVGSFLSSGANFGSSVRIGVAGLTVLAGLLGVQQHHANKKDGAGGAEAGGEDGNAGSGESAGAVAQVVGALADVIKTS